MNDTYLDLAEVAKRLLLSTRTVRSRVNDLVDPIPAYRVRGKFLFRWSAVEEWIQAHRIQPMDADELAADLVNSALRDAERTSG